MSPFSQILRISLAFPLSLLAFPMQESLHAQEDILRLDEIRVTQKRRLIQIPEVNGFRVLKCDFHMHTVFTDGAVWPTVRVQEAWREGLDAFAFTEHLEYTPYKDDVNVNPARPHEITQNRAAEQNLTLIKGAELTRGTPPGHFNALFIEDPKLFISDSNSALDQEAIDKAVEQKAFIFWNHPGWQATRDPKSYDWLPFIEKQFQDKKLQGVEVANGFSIYLKSIDWALDRNLTILANTDIHNVVAYDYDLTQVGAHRTMTLVFAKDQSPAAIREALETGRTVAWAGKYLIGKEENVRDLFHACVSLGAPHHTKSNAAGKKSHVYEIKNQSDLTFELKLTQGNATRTLLLEPFSAQLLTADEGQDALQYEVSNTMIRSDRALTVTLKLP